MYMYCIVSNYVCLPECMHYSIYTYIYQVLYPAVADILSSVDINEVPLLVPYTQGMHVVYFRFNFFLI